ncbi:MAG: CoA protein activase [Deltaproteobacteria bacterium]|nr:CoA protein activase [Deltaproteobacteria bacterium]
MKKRLKPFRVGLDIGSTTAKIAIIDQDLNVVLSLYKRHNTRVTETLGSLVDEAIKKLGDQEAVFLLTGSAGLGISERAGIPFTQEVIATDICVHKKYPLIKTLIDIGGEDSKMIFFSDGKPPDIRMNGNCAGGTGSFIDQMINLLDISPLELNRLAEKYQKLYPIASRCGVFAKTDIQNLLARNVPKSDIAASIFHAIVIQCMNTLARGRDIEPGIILCGGPFTFYPQLIQFFIKETSLTSNDIVIPEYSNMLPALGAAFDADISKGIQTFNQFSDRIKDALSPANTLKNRLKPLFKNSDEYLIWQKKHDYPIIEKCSLSNYLGTRCFLGIDSGSTTTKIVVIGDNSELLFSWYRNNCGNAIDSVLTGLNFFKKEKDQHASELEIVKTSVTGYGEDLIQAALGIDHGIVETIAHFTAAQSIQPEVSFVLDIGGQDMKAIFISNGSIHRIELNEACSSGCGSFIETFGQSLGIGISEFAEMACLADAPCDLGTRCTVFMNSKVKQSLRENASVAEISAGLSYSVIKNCLFKVLNLTRMSDLGDRIVVQGGTFKNHSLVRALELLSEKEVRVSNIPELMGAFGAALIAQNNDRTFPDEITSFIGLENLISAKNYKTRQVNCKGCENMCLVTRFSFDHHKSYFSGNKCESFFSSRGKKLKAGTDFFKIKNHLLFSNAPPVVDPQQLKIGLPRSLGMYESLPFWETLFTSCGFAVVLSSPSTVKICEKGMGMIMSDSICFPAKLMHGHVEDLIEKTVDRIFYPLAIYETKEFSDSTNSYNCPIVSSYGEVIKSANDPLGKTGIPFDNPVVNFNDIVLLRKSLQKYLKPFKISHFKLNQALEKALIAQTRFKKELKKQGEIIIQAAIKQNRLLIVLAGRPYHLDPLINHKTPEVLAALGTDVISEDAISYDNSLKSEQSQVLMQWSYPTRILKAAEWVSKQPQNIQMVQLNSFGCGPDALVTDEVREILKTAGKNYTLIKVDEINSTGSVRLRLRSLLESLKLKDQKEYRNHNFRITTPFFENEDRKRTILAPHFADSYSPLIPAVFALAGYKMVNLPRPDRESVELGLQYSNHDICYPATIVVGDIIKALKSGKYNHEEIAIGITQTGGQCRASSYLSLIKKAMISAGYNDIPIISCTLAEGLNHQPGFKVDWLKLLKILFCAALFADSLAKMYYATVSREKNTGESKQLQDYYLKELTKIVRLKDYQTMFTMFEKSVNDFNQISVYPRNLPKIGIVGEIFLKYNGFANQHIIDWLIGQGIEVVVPPIIDFFKQDFINIDYNAKVHLSKRRMKDFFVKFLDIYTRQFERHFNHILTGFRFYSPFHDLSKAAQSAKEIISLANQFGEGWLIAAEIGSFASDDINYVISLQPFGCIANHVVSKGVEKKIKQQYPDMNLLFLDFEAGTSEVNILNRLYFMVKSLKKQQGVA